MVEVENSQNNKHSESAVDAGEPLPYFLGRSLVDDGLVDVESLMHSTVMPTGLEELAKAEKVYIFQHFEPFPFSTEFPPLSYYTIVNASCEKINIAAELNCSGTDKAFIMHMFTPDGDLVVKIVERNRDIWLIDKKFEDLAGGDLKKYLERDRQLPSLWQRRTSDSEPEYEVVEQKPDAHIHMELSDGDFLGTLWRSDSAWVIHDTYLIPVYTIPEEPDPRYPTPNRHAQDVIYSYYSAGAEINSTIGYPLGKIETNVELTEQCGPDAAHWACIGIQFPDHFYVVDKTLVVGVALNQYCRIQPLAITQRKSNTVAPPRHKCFVILCTVIIIFIAILAILIAVGIIVTFQNKHTT